MRKVLYILGILSDEDLDWIVAVGENLPVDPGQILIREDIGQDSFFIVLSGRFSISVASQPGRVLADVSQGEVLGEIGMLDSRPPLATVTAATDSQVLRISYADLAGKLETDEGFSARFHRALAVFLAHRIRATTFQLSKGEQRNVNILDENVEGADEIDPELMDAVALAGKRFEWILQRLKDR